MRPLTFCTFISVFIFKLVWAESVFSPHDQLIIDQVKREIDVWRLNNPDIKSFHDYNFKYFHQVSAECSHCPASELLTRDILNVLKKIPGAEGLGPVGDFELQYAIEASKENSQIKCKSVFQAYDDTFRPKKLDGQLIQVAEGVFKKFPSVNGLRYNNSSMENIIYYFKDKTNHVVQVVLNKDGSSYYKYYQLSSSLVEPVQLLPDLPTDDSSVIQNLNKAQTESSYVEPKESVTLRPENDGFHVQTTIKTHEEIHDSLFSKSTGVPSDYRIGAVSQTISTGGVGIKGSIDSKIRSGNNIQLGVETGSGTQVAIVHARTNIQGKLEDESITIPLNLNLDAVDSENKIEGALVTSRSNGESAQSLVLKVVDTHEPAGSVRRDYVTVVATNSALGTYVDIRKNFVTKDGKVITAGAGKNLAGNYVQASYSPSNDLKKGDMVTISAISGSGNATIFAIYLRPF